jgi:UMF1 family MFS transporter
VISRHNKAIWGWVLYDWANSAFATTVMAGFFPIFFKTYWNSGVDINTSTARLGLANSLASVIVALMAPIAGAIADQGSRKKHFLTFFAYLGSSMTVGLLLVHQGQWLTATFFYIMGIIGYSGANVFYDSLLPTVATEKEYDRVSGLGFAMGYLGGGLLFALNVIMYQWPGLFGISSGVWAIRISFVTVGIWWATFTIFTILWVEETVPARMNWAKAIGNGFRAVIITFKKIRHLKMAFIFLLGYWLYIDGVDTIIRMAVDYGLSLGFDEADLIAALLITQFVGFPAAILYSFLGEKWGTKRALLLGLAFYIGITLWGVTMNTRLEFYLLAIAIGLVQGGIQALSRSFYSRLIPKNQAAEFFGFYGMLGKFAAIIGPILMAYVGLLAKRILMPLAASPEEIVAVSQLASRWSIASLLLLFIAGGTLLWLVDEEQGKRDAKSFELK